MKKIFLFVAMMFATMSFANTIEEPKQSETVLVNEVKTYNEEYKKSSEINSENDLLIICTIFRSYHYVGSGVDQMTGQPYDTYAVVTWGYCREF